MSDLHGKITARLSELRAVAQAATQGLWVVASNGEVHTVAVHPAYKGDNNPKPYRVVTNGDFHESVDGPDAAHIATWNPAHSLSWIEWAEEVARRHEHTTETIKRAPFNEITGEPQGPDCEVTCAVCDWVGDVPGALCADMSGLARALDIEVSG